MKAPLIALFVVPLGFLALGAGDATPKLDLPNGWTLKSMTSGGVETPALKGAGRAVTIFFKSATISGSGGVNSYSGRAKMRGGAMRHRGFSATEMASEDPKIMKQEGDYFALLGEVSRFEFDGKELVLSDRTKAKQLRFAPTVLPAGKPLVGTSWGFTGFEESDGTSVSHSQPIAGTTIDLAFGGDGKVSGSAGVNRYFGKGLIDLNAGTVAIGGIGSTRKGGAPEAMRQEAKFLKRLQAMTRYQIKAGRLALSDDKGSHRLLFEAQ